jgi:hypothetical protein
MDTLKELLFIKALALKSNQTEKKIIEEFNNGNILIFNKKTLRDFYIEAFEGMKVNIDNYISIELKNGRLHQLGLNLFVLFE